MLPPFQIRRVSSCLMQGFQDRQLALKLVHRVANCELGVERQSAPRKHLWPEMCSGSVVWNHLL